MLTALYPGASGAGAGEKADARGFVHCSAQEVRTNPVRCSITGTGNASDGSDVTLHLQIEGIAEDLDEALLCIDYDGESAELYQDGRLVADSFYTGQIWEVGLKRFAAEEKAEFTMVIHPLRKDAALYLEKWPEMENGIACRLNGIRTEVIVREELH